MLYVVVVQVYSISRAERHGFQRCAGPTTALTSVTLCIAWQGCPKRSMAQTWLLLAARPMRKGARRKPEMRRKSPRIARGRRNSLMTLSELPLEEDHAAALLHDAFYLALAEHKITAILKTSAMHLARC